MTVWFFYRFVFFLTLMFFLLISRGSIFLYPFSASWMEIFLISFPHLCLVSEGFVFPLLFVSARVAHSKSGDSSPSHLLLPLFSFVISLGSQKSRAPPSRSSFSQSDIFPSDPLERIVLETGLALFLEIWIFRFDTGGFVTEEIERGTSPIDFVRLCRNSIGLD